MKFATRTLDTQHLLFDADAVSEIDSWLFDPAQLERRNCLSGQPSRRGTTWFFSNGNLALVLRHYRRHGFAAHLLGDRYLYTGMRRTRAWREWQLLAHMHALGLPVPQPIAARIVRDGMWYRADLITRRIFYTDPLAEKLKHKGLDASRWRGIGLCIRRFHDAGVFHADLNAHNILLGKENTVFLADFDKGELRKPADGWKRQNLERLRRSLTKLRGSLPEFCYSDADWVLLTEAYESAS